MANSLLATLILSLCTIACGCVDCMRFPEQLPLRVEAPSHPNVALIQVTSARTTEMVQTDGAYILDLPGGGFGYCDFFGIPLHIPPFTCDPERGEYVLVKDNGVVLRKLPVSQIRKLPKDSEGKRIVKVK
jgi:hypothetical protein